jgi:glycogen debranching enzyme
VDLAPCLFPYIQPTDPDWRERYEQFNQPGEYHNGGVWPFIGSFHVAACVAAGRTKLAHEKLMALTRLVQPSRDHKVDWGFNEWIKAQTGQPRGCDWQTWSAAMYLYAAQCVESERTPFFDEVREAAPGARE